MKFVDKSDMKKHMNRKKHATDRAMFAQNDHNSVQTKFETNEATPFSTVTSQNTY